jgi:hypothetical protein
VCPHSRAPYYRCKGHRPKNKNLSWVRIPMKMVSVAVITVDNAVFGFTDYLFTMIFSDRPLINFGARKIVKKIDKKM